MIRLDLRVAPALTGIVVIAVAGRPSRPTYLDTIGPVTAPRPLPTRRKSYRKRPPSHRLI